MAQLSLSPLQRYQQAVDSGRFHEDPVQRRAAQALDQCLEELAAGGRVKGVYLWGAVGRGKTWLLDAFHQSLQVPSRRQHFHHFMRWLHKRLFQLTGNADPLRLVAQELGRELRVLCFDELYVGDIGDAMLLGRLFSLMFEQGITLVTTSNQPPDQLYTDSFSRDRFAPAVRAIEQHMRIIEVNGEQDHRLHPGEARTRYWVTTDQKQSPLAAVFEQLSAGLEVHHAAIDLAHRQIAVERYSETALWCNFSELCEQPLASQDFIALCDRFPNILLGRVPRLGGKQREGRIARGTEDAVERVEAGDRQLPMLSPKDDSVRRFIALVDECYDRGVPLYIEADVAMDELYTEGYLSFAFRRTLSRLQEMQLERFAASSDA